MGPKYRMSHIQEIEAEHRLVGPKGLRLKVGQSDEFTGCVCVAYVVCVCVRVHVHRCMCVAYVWCVCVCVYVCVKSIHFKDLSLSFFLCVRVCGVPLCVCVCVCLRVITVV